MEINLSTLLSNELQRYLSTPMGAKKDLKPFHDYYLKLILNAGGADL